MPICHMERGKLRRIAKLFLVSLLIFTALSGCSGSGTPQVLKALVETELGISVLAVNLQGVEDRYGNSRVRWQDRYDRIGDWLQLNRSMPYRGFPDILALQEVHGKSNVVMPYETVFRILAKIRQMSGKDYRIAYLGVVPIRTGIWTVWAGQSVLYDAGRLTNLSQGPGSNVRLSEHDQLDIFGFHSRKSLPCHNPPANYLDECQLLDGDGRFWTSGGTRSYDKRFILGPILSRFELKAAQGNPIHIYNVHAPLDYPDAKKEYTALFQELRSSIESDLGADRLYPPIILGDFNMDTRRVVAETEPGFPDFQIAGFSNREVMGVLIGKQAIFPSKLTAYYRSLVVPDDKEDQSMIDPKTGGTTSACGDIRSFWSDHCGVLVHFSPLAMPTATLPACLQANGNTMESGECLEPGQSIKSANGEFQFICLGDSHLVLERIADGFSLWGTDNFGRQAGVCRQFGGKLVVYDLDGNQVWASGFAPDLNVETRLVLGDDGRIAISALGGPPIWSRPIRGNPISQVPN
jgi:hypothetical protein